MSSEQPTGDFPQPIGQPPYAPWPAPPLQAPVSLPEPGPPIDEINPILAKYDVPEVVPDVNPGPDWGGIANGLNPVDIPRMPAYTTWTKLSHDAVGSGVSQLTFIVEGTYVDGMGTLVRSIVVSGDAGVAVSTSFLPGVKIADHQLVPFSHQC